MGGGWNDARNVHAVRRGSVMLVLLLIGNTRRRGSIFSGAVKVSFRVGLE